MKIGLLDSRHLRKPHFDSCFNYRWAKSSREHASKRNFLEKGPQLFPLPIAYDYFVEQFQGKVSGEECDWNIQLLGRKFERLQIITMFFSCVCTRNYVILNDDFLMLWVKHVWHIWFFGLCLHWGSNWGPCLIYHK